MEYYSYCYLNPSETNSHLMNVFVDAENQV